MAVTNVSGILPENLFDTARNIGKSNQNGSPFGDVLVNSIQDIQKIGTHYEKQTDKVAKGLGSPEELVEIVSHFETSLKAVQSAIGAGMNAVKETFHLQI